MAKLFNQQHFVAMAEVIKTQLDACSSAEQINGMEKIIVEMIRLFRRHNNAFRTIYFLNKCGYTDDAAHKMLERNGYQYNY